MSSKSPAHHPPVPTSSRSAGGVFDHPTDLTRNTSINVDTDFNYIVRYSPNSDATASQQMVLVPFFAHFILNGMDPPDGEDRSLGPRTRRTASNERWKLVK